MPEASPADEPLSRNHAKSNNSPKPANKLNTEASQNIIMSIQNSNIGKKVAHRRKKVAHLNQSVDNWNV